MQHRSRQRPLAVRRAIRRMLVLLLLLLLSPVLGGSHPLLAAGNVGYRDVSYSGTSAPTADKPQSKLWVNDGSWWGSLFNSTTRKFQIYGFNWATNTWRDTGTVIDERPTSSADC